MGDTLQNLSERIRLGIAEPTANAGGGLITGTEIRFWINECIGELNSELQFLTAENTVTPQVGYLGNTPATDMAHPQALLWALYDNNPLEIKTADDIQAFPSIYTRPRTETGTPHTIYEWQGNHYLYPLIASSPVTNGLIRGYLKKHTDLLNPSDTSPLPTNCDRAIVTYGIWQGKKKRGYADAVQAQAEYIALFQVARRTNRPSQEPRTPYRHRPGGFGGASRGLWDGATIPEPT